MVLRENVPTQRWPYLRWWTGGVPRVRGWEGSRCHDPVGKGVSARCYLVRDLGIYFTYKLQKMKKLVDGQPPHSSLTSHLSDFYSWRWAGSAFTTGGAKNFTLLSSWTGGNHKARDGLMEEFADELPMPLPPPPHRSTGSPGVMLGHQMWNRDVMWGMVPMSRHRSQHEGENDTRRCKHYRRRTERPTGRQIQIYIDRDSSLILSDRGRIFFYPFLSFTRSRSVSLTSTRLVHKN